MQFPHFQLPTVFFVAALSTALGLSGCGSTCVVGFSIDGNGGVIVRAGDPPPACSLAQAKGAMTALAVKSPVCDSCAPSPRVNHIFLTLQGIQIRSNTAIDDPSSSQWIELAPQLKFEPRQFDLLGDSQPAILAENTSLPAGIYRQVRLQFLNTPPANTGLSTLNACGVDAWNCTISGDGVIEPLIFPPGAPEVLTLLQDADTDSLLVLPDARLELRLFLELRQGPKFSLSGGWNNHSVVLGHAKVVPQESLPLEHSAATQTF
jgi:hypothetical protein